MTTHKTEALTAAMKPQMPTYDDYYVIGLAESLAQSLYKNNDLSVMHGSHKSVPRVRKAITWKRMEMAKTAKLKYYAAIVKNDGSGGHELMSVDQDRGKDMVTPVFEGATRLEAAGELLFWLEEKAGGVLTNA